MKNYILILLFSLLISSFYSQLDYKGWKTWQSIAVNHKLNKKSEIQGVLAARNRHALSTTDQLYVDLSYGRELKKRQNISLGYRLIFDNEEYNNQYINRLNFDYSYRIKLVSKHSLTLRNRFQSKFYYNNESAIVDRIRAKYSYKYSKKLNLAVYTEGFFKLDPNLLFYKYRVGASINYKLQKRLKIAVKYILINEINVAAPSSFNVFSISLRKTIK